MFGRPRLRVQADMWVRDDTSMDVALDPAITYRPVVASEDERPSLLVSNGDIFWNIHAPDADGAQDFADAAQRWADSYNDWEPAP